MKWDAIEPSRNGFSFANADYHVKWMKDHGQLVRGHTLGKTSRAAQIPACS